MIDLKNILLSYPNCLDSRASFKSVLMDKYPTEKRMVNILTILFECGVANRIKMKKCIDSNEMQGLINQIENEYGISENYSRDAIMIWAAAFNATVSAVPTVFSETLSEKSVTAVEPKPIIYVQGDVDDYEVVQKTDGYYISHFNGFEEEVMTIPSLIDGKKIKGIAEDAFKGCVTVKRISLSEGIEIVENRAFKECKSLESVVLPNTLKRIGSKSNEYGIGAFSNTKLVEITIPPEVDFVGPYTFNYCTNLKRVRLGDKIEVINKSTFSHCTSLTDISLPKQLKIIDENAFEECRSLQSVHVPVGTQRIANKAFKDAKLSAIYIPPTVIHIGMEEGNRFSREETFGYILIPKDFTIYCTAGSVAMEYARKNNIKCAKAVF